MSAETKEAGLKKLGAARRRAVGASAEGWVRTCPLYADKSLPLLIQPAVGGIDLLEWVGRQRDFVSRNLEAHGALLFRNFDLRGAADFESFARAASDGEPLPYKERSSPRSRVAGNIYTSTDYPADQSIFLHNENSYQQTWPMKIFFYCAVAPEQGGETPIADTRRVFARLSPELRRRFVEKGWMYVRNFGEHFGLPWQTVFQTSDRERVEGYCRDNGIEVEWREGDRLKTRAVRPAVSTHPLTGEQLWFNHATFFHVTTLAPTVRDFFLSTFKEEDLPTNTYYGDGSPLEESALEELRRAYGEETVSFTWRQGDILLLDNMLAAHGRAPYTGPREILVGMTEPFCRVQGRQG
jgi:alpha-ketoglutarate-dependent taurine dioxygenase